MIEANPRASRTVPFVAKATGMPLVEAACRSRSATARRPRAARDDARMSSVKEAVLPFARFPGADALLGPEMRATGEVMGIGPDFATAFAKAARAAGQPLPGPGRPPAGGRDHRQRPRQAGRRRSSPSGSTTSASASTPPAARPGRSAGSAHRSTRSRRCTRRGSATIPELITERRGRPGGEHAARPRRARRRLRDPARHAPRPRCRASRRCPARRAAVQAMARAWKVDPKPLQELHLGQAVDARAPA